MTILLEMVRGKGVSSPTEKLDKEGSLDVNVAGGGMLVCGGRSCLFVCAAQQRLSPGSFLLEIEYG